MERRFELVPLRESQSELLLAARRNRPYARARLIESFMPLIGSVARIYARVPAVDRSELMQEGVVGVLRALERYDPELETPFWAYASWWVRQAMQQVVSELSRPVVLSDRALRQLARVRDARRTFVRTNTREPSVQELASASELTLEQLHRLTVADRQPRGLEEPIDEPGGTSATFGDSLRDPRAEEVFDELPLRLGAAEIPRLLAQLSRRERAVIAARYGLDGPERTLRELGRELGVSAERVRQIEQTALEKMRAAYAVAVYSRHCVPQALAS
ncbi:MAG TPA: sigma-70 family RNA polymerase sigma factor [Solirubrobacteraceae bacterium]|nr:sigma-70 family RNA polymerase sigma factor [Solirubrobacteraceae bacterium]